MEIKGFSCASPLEYRSTYLTSRGRQIEPREQRVDTIPSIHVCLKTSPQATAQHRKVHILSIPKVLTFPTPE